MEDILAALALKSGVANSTEAYFLDYSLEKFLKLYYLPMKVADRAAPSPITLLESSIKQLQDLEVDAINAPQSRSSNSMSTRQSLTQNQDADGYQT